MTKAHSAPIARGLIENLAPGRTVTLANVPAGMEGLVIGDLARALAAKDDAAWPTLTVICRDVERMAELERALAFFAPEVERLSLPGWDCLPYDRASPHGDIVARRMTTLARLARVKGREGGSVVLTTVDAALQRVPKRALIGTHSFSAAPGNALSLDDVTGWAEVNGFIRTPTVRDTGEYAVRGGIVDLFPPGLPLPVRLDFFGDTLESIRSFDPETQRTAAQMRALDLVPMSELQLTSETMRRFRMAYVAQFGAAQRGDMLYEAVSEGRRYPGMEHWLPLFHDGLDTLFDYTGDSPVVMEAQSVEAAGERLAQIRDYYDARRESQDLAHAHSGQGMLGSGAPYKPLPPEALYLTEAEWAKRREAAPAVALTAFAVPPSKQVIDLGGRAARSFAPERADPEANLFEAAVGYLRELSPQKRTVVTAWSEGSLDRLTTVLGDHGLRGGQRVGTRDAAETLPKGAIGFSVLGIESGFETDTLVVIGEQDILGDRLVRPKRKARRPQDVISELSALTAGDLVVHVDHGIGRFVGLKTIEAMGAPHDCLEIHYAEGSKLFLPVENLELLSRYGSEDTEAQLDRLGGGGWQARKAKMRSRIREMAAELIKVAAERQLKEAPRLVPAEGVYDEFRARFPYEETEDQEASIEAVFDDLGSGHPMDRLVCGDVGFGKTEVALRAAFAVALNGKQVAVVVPTTLLARQHFKTFSERFKGLPVVVRQLSRLVPSKEVSETKKGLADGTVDIVVGTHALLGKAISFKDLGLVIVDEEQHFGVGHKEKLKQLRAEVHVLTLTATPIPRTLQLAMTGVRELSIIASPPVDRLAVRSFVTPFDPLIVREALLRERYRGGQSFYVCPRIEDLGEVKEFLDKNVPEVKVTIAHGQMAATQLEEIMTAFYDGQFDVLLSTTIVESGLDVPNANTLIIHRSDMFGLAQLYQLRGRVGRSKTRAYAIFTLPAEKQITQQAEKRLKVLQSLDTLGAGFQLASHDLDIRGAGNLLGDEQSGHIKEVGYELYQEMLEEAIANLKAGITAPVAEKWSPQISIGAPVLIPEDYVADLHVRLNLYRRLADLETEEEIEEVGTELIDRFGPAPEEVKQFLKLVAIKAMCRRANVEKVDAGPRGAVLTFRENQFPNTAGLVAYLGKPHVIAKVRPDLKVVFSDDWPEANARLKGVGAILKELAKIAGGTAKAA
ncbi:transcription-repair coupling factor [Ancylobacter defluvii]|uniref:Transcription-repair-coupling factor n=1 Tax=Ancylobacter defluvii TaxID=1282440 RepID=A0A9W6JZX6_9HYPH|nr:transcription-repair coupling factor [Ancylobacter defluvii]MBS7586033.1 transcription-repair coupling factor [Ancylobacter defluvii]GLK84413.1 transcription-repair-coupling factor [Ancylobacter defluvii]